MQAAVDSKQKIIDAQVSPREQGLQARCRVRPPPRSLPAVQRCQLGHGRMHRAAVGDGAGQTSAGCDLLSQHSPSYSCSSLGAWQATPRIWWGGGGNLGKDHAHNSASLWKDCTLVGSVGGPRSFAWGFMFQ